MCSKHYRTNFNLKKLIVPSLICLATLIPDQAYAQAALFDSGTNFLTALEALLTGTWARLIAIIAVIILGFGWMSGRITWAVAGAMIGGIILVFGSAAIVDGISGSL